MRRKQLMILALLSTVVTEVNAENVAQIGDADEAAFAEASTNSS